jgi:hypothetical protein
MSNMIPEMGMIIPDMGMTDYEKKLSSYLFSKTRRGLLALLFGRTDESFYVNQIVQRLGSGSGERLTPAGRQNWTSPRALTIVL